jgi:hypothetical protein
VGAWRKIAVGVVAVLLAAGLFPTLRAIVQGPQVAGSLSVPAPDAGRVAAASCARRAAAPGAQRILLVGNSVAYLLAPAFKQLPNPLAVFNGAVLGCVFPPEIRRPPAPVNGKVVDLAPCHPSWEAQVVKAFQPNIVFWIMPTRGWIGGTYHGRSITGCSGTFNALYERSLSREVARLRAEGAKVIVTTSPYSRRAGVTNDPKEDDCENQLRRSAARTSGAQLADLFEFVCPHGHCLTKMDGVTLRPDGLHYEGPGATIVAQWLMDQVR